MVFKKLDAEIYIKNRNLLYNTIDFDYFGNVILEDVEICFNENFLFLLYDNYIFKNNISIKYKELFLKGVIE